MKIERINADPPRVEVSGRMDSAGAQAGAERFRELVIAPGQNVILDLSGVEFMASVGMRLLIEAHKELDARGARVVLAGPRELVAEGLRIAGIDRMLTVVADPASAAFD